jgi:4-amino-4-deoxy-L-arabinose transferase-like glycosyltransferase
VNFLNENPLCSKKWAVILVFLFVLTGSVIRLQELGKHGFWTDELLHVIGAKSLLETGSPLVPGKGEYTRAFPITCITALSIKFLGENEVTARLPFVLINVLFIVIGYFLIQHLFNTNIALIFSFVMAFSPLEMVMSRECRMYSLFQLMYFIGSMIFFIGFEQKCNDSNRFKFRLFENYERSIDINIFYLAIAAAVFYFSLKIHALTLNFVFVLLFYLLIRLVQVTIKEGIRTSIASKYFILTGIICVSGLISFLIFPNFFRYNFLLSTSVPEWANGEAFRYDFYQTYFTRHYPVFTYIYPLSILFLVIKYREKGVFILSSFLPLIILHIFVYTGRMSERYIFYIFPFFILGASCMVEICIASCFELIKEYRNVRPKVIYFFLLICFIPAMYVFAKPWLGETRYVKDTYYGTDWKSVTAELQAIPKNSLIISTRIRPVYYYSGRMPDYNVRKSLFEISEKDVKIGDKTLSINIIDNSSNLEMVINTKKDVYFLAEKWSWNLPGYMDDSMRLVIEKNFLPMPHRGNKEIMIYKKKDN